MDLSDPNVVSLCMIVKDAEKTIESLLMSVVRTSHGPAFDEYVFVDTGSSDRTREIIADAFDIDPRAWPKLTRPGIVDSFKVKVGGTEVRVRLASFEWIDDFAAARNFSFEIATCRWRMYLDADDRLEKGANIKPTLLHLEQNSPAINCLSMKYDYCPPETVQDKIRIVKWADGWKWRLPIHEELIRISGQRQIAGFPDIIVRHEPADRAQHGLSSVDRNAKICLKARAKAVETGDEWLAGIMSFYLGTYGRVGMFDPDTTRAYLKECTQFLGATNLAAYAQVELAQLEIAEENYQAAIDASTLAIARYPEMIEGHGMLGWSYFLAKQQIRAVQAFDRFATMQKQPFQSHDIRVLSEGILNVFAAKTFLAANRMNDAAAMIKRIPDEIAQHDAVWPHFSRVAADYHKIFGLQQVKAYSDYLVWNNEPVKAVEVLDRYVPSNVEARVEISVMRKEITDKMQQLNSWADYKRVYAAETNEVFDRTEDGVNIIRAMGRAQASLMWAKALPKEGPPLQLYTIGIHGGWIEEDIMDACPRIHLTACDVNPNANTAIQRLLKKFPGRVAFHQVVKHHTDWIPEGKEGFYDALLCFEVIEHLPDDGVMLETINRLLKPGGELLLSTPIAEYWVAPDATRRHHWHQHVRAYQPHQLWDRLREYGFEGDVFSTDTRILFFCQVRKAREVWTKHVRSEGGAPLARYVPTDDKKIAIWIPSTPKPFDPKSPGEGHVGGSEEAVIHLAPALARLGYAVEVYVEKPDRITTPHVVQSVLWRPLEEFDPLRLKGTVFVWRSPVNAAWLKAQNSKLRVLNWLHDVSYGAKPETYAQADGTVVLSKFHAKAIEEFDGFKGPFLFGANGIDPAEFEGLDWTKRDNHRAIYASAPNRGLDMLLDAWPLIRKEVPDATLKIYYGWEITRKMMKTNAKLRHEMQPLLDRLESKLAALKNQGVEYVGGVDHATLHKAYAASGVWTYPVHCFEETYCISAIKAQAAGTIPVTIDTGAIPEYVRYGEIHVLGKVDVHSFAASVAHHMKYGGEFNRKLMSNWALKHNSWDEAAHKFAEFTQRPAQRIAIYAPKFFQFDYTSLHEPKDGQQVGGSEEAVIALSETLAEQGVDVTVFTRLPTGEGTASKSPAGAHWRCITQFDRSAEWDTLIVGRDPTFAAELKEARPSQVILNWLMDPTYFVKRRTLWDNVDATVTLTKAHADMLGETDMLPNKAKVVPLGLLLEELPPLSPQNDQARHPEWVMWATSPDRGLLRLLQNWDKVRAQVPNAQLHIFYGIEKMMERASRDPGFVETYKPYEIEKLIKEGEGKGIVYHGAVSRTELMGWHVRCGTWAYSCEGFNETFCMSVVKAQACGVWPVVTNTGCLPEVTRYGAIVSGDMACFVEELVKTIKNPPTFEMRKRMADDTRERFSRQNMARGMIRLIEGIKR